MSITITDTVKNLPNKKGVDICCQQVKVSPPAPTFLKKCHGHRFVGGCYKTFTEVAGSIVAQLELPAGGARFLVGGQTPGVTSSAPPRRPRRRLTIKGVNLSEVTGVTIGGVSARIAEDRAYQSEGRRAHEGALSGDVQVSSSAGMSTSATVFTVRRRTASARSSSITNEVAGPLTPADSFCWTASGVRRPWLRCPATYWSHDGHDVPTC